MGEWVQREKHQNIKGKGTTLRRKENVVEIVKRVDDADEMG